MSNKSNSKKPSIWDDLNSDLYDMNFKKTLNLLREETIILMSQKGKFVEKYKALFELALFYLNSLNIKKANVAFNEQLLLINKSSKTLTEKHEIITRLYLSHCLRLEGKNKEAVDILIKAVPLVHSEEEWILFMINYNLGLAYCAANSNKDALKIWIKCLSKTNKYYSVSIRWKIVRSLIQVTWMMGQFKECLGYLSLLKTELLVNQFLSHADKNKIDLIDDTLSGLVPELNKIDNFDSKNTSRVE
ncbi:hypothetical protein HZS_6176 [Henneguya salminicola]|nr:hypothetical protein HZS_6176 [Henneguya salminicola]